jgi:hypothetical protein
VLDIQFTVDTSELTSVLRDLSAHLSDPIFEIVYRLVCLPEAFPKLFRIEVDRLTATGTRDVRTVLKPTDLYFQLMSAVRAIKGDGLIVEESGHMSTTPASSQTTA